MTIYCILNPHSTYVDFMLYELIDQIQMMEKDALAPYKNLQDFHAQIEALPTLSAYINHVHESKIPVNGPSASWR